MSDLSGLDQSFALPALAAPEDVSAYVHQPVSHEVQPHEVSFKRLRGAHEIARILHFREEISLSSAVLADAGFTAREKKEMK